MTREDTAQILAILKAAFPNSYKNLSKDEAQGIITVWALQFRDVPVDIVLIALHKTISNSLYPPTVAAIRSKFRMIQIEAQIAYNDGITGRVPMSEADLLKYKRIADILRPYYERKDNEVLLNAMIDMLPNNTTVRGLIE